MTIYSEKSMFVVCVIVHCLIVKCFKLKRPFFKIPATSARREKDSKRLLYRLPMRIKDLRLAVVKSGGCYMALLYFSNYKLNLVQQGFQC